MTTLLTLSESQRIAEDIVGAVAWNGVEGHCTCPGIAKHTTGNAPTDCKVVCEHTGTVAPGVYCFHGSCHAETEVASFVLRSALGKHSPSSAPMVRSTLALPKRPTPKFDPTKLAHIARKLDGIDAEWFVARSPKRPDTSTPATFLHELYAPGERVIIFDVFESQGQAVWKCTPPPFDTRALDAFRIGKPNGVWFLCNPVTGDYLPNDKGTLSRRSWQNVTSWRYMVLESDAADPAHWLASLAQLPLPIAAIYTSGGKSIHALVRLGAESKKQWDDTAARLKPMVITLGADRAAITAVRLTRLPQCERVEKGEMQKLLYLDGKPDLCPIADKPILRPGWMDMPPADQSGLNV